MRSVLLLDVEAALDETATDSSSLIPFILQSRKQSKSRQTLVAEAICSFSLSEGWISGNWPAMIPSRKKKEIRGDSTAALEKQPLQLRSKQKLSR